MARSLLTLRLAPLALLAGCMGWGDLDPFGVTERPVGGGYRLKAWEDGSYFLLAPADTRDGERGAPVERLGWDARHVVVLRGGARGEPAAWTVIELPAGRVRRVSAAGLASDRAVGRIPTFRADSAWSRLGGRGAA